MPEAYSWPCFPSRQRSRHPLTNAKKRVFLPPWHPATDPNKSVPCSPAHSLVFSRKARHTRSSPGRLTNTFRRRTHGQAPNDLAPSSDNSTTSRSNVTSWSRISGMSRTRPGHKRPSRRRSRRSSPRTRNTTALSGRFYFDDTKGARSGMRARRFWSSIGNTFACSGAIPYPRSSLAFQRHIS